MDVHSNLKRYMCLTRQRERERSYFLYWCSSCLLCSCHHCHCTGSLIVSQSEPDPWNAADLSSCLFLSSSSRSTAPCLPWSASHRIDTVISFLPVCPSSSLLPHSIPLPTNQNTNIASYSALGVRGQTR